MSRKLAIVTAFVSLSVSSSIAAAVSERDYITIVGSSTVYPFATVVAERFGKTSGFKTPKIESTGSGGGLKLFCAGVGVEHLDITNASRRIRKSEYDKCHGNGVTEIVEVKVGYDGIVIAVNSRKAPLMELSRQDRDKPPTGRSVGRGQGLARPTGYRNLRRSAAALYRPHHRRESGSDPDG